MKEIQDYIFKMEQKYGEEWPNYLPVYAREHEELLEGWGFKVHGLSVMQLGEMFSNVLTDEILGTDYRNREIDLNGLASTCEVLEWILTHGCPELYCTHFRFPDDTEPFGFFEGLPRSLVVSSIPKDEVVDVVDAPVEKWHEPIPGIRRVFVDGLLWYAEVSGRYYYITK